MKARLAVFGAALLVAGIAIRTAAANDTAIALVSKVILDVMRKPVGKDWQPAQRGEVLASGERVKTGERSVAVIKFKDNSMLRVRERTEVVLSGVQEGSTFSKSAEVERGVIGFSIRKQQAGEEFRFSSPTSVASIRGTSGQFSTSDSSDKLIVLEGLVRLMNKISSETIDVGTGFTGVSSRDGKLELRRSTPEEAQAAEASTRAAEQENQLDIELDDGRGNKRRMEIKFK